MSQGTDEGGKKEVKRRVRRDLDRQKLPALRLTPSYGCSKSRRINTGRSIRKGRDTELAESKVILLIGDGDHYHLYKRKTIEERALFHGGAKEVGPVGTYTVLIDIRVA